MNAPTIYDTTSLPPVVMVVGALGALLLAVLGVCTLVNRVAHRPLLNGWLYGASFVVLLLAYHFWVAYAAGSSPDLHAETTDIGEAIGLALGLVSLLGLATWRGLVWRRRVGQRSGVTPLGVRHSGGDA